MTDKTPRTDAVATEGKLFKEGWYSTLQDYVTGDFSRQLETELSAAKAENATLREKLEAAEQDTARLDWLERFMSSGYSEQFYVWFENNYYRVEYGGQHPSKAIYLREAIDGAMK